MNKVLFIALLLMSNYAIAQESSLVFGDTVKLQEVTVYAKQNLSIIKSSHKKNSIHVSGRGKTLLVSKVDLNAPVTLDIEGLEFFFNYDWQGFSSESFYIKPLIYSSVNEEPGIDVLNSQRVYEVSRDINKIIHIDLSEETVVLQHIKTFFVGIEFIEAVGETNFEDFNVTMIPLKKTTGVSFLKANCSSCDFTPFDMDEKTGLSLKYNIYYKK